jgi:hypothetical protein
VAEYSLLKATMHYVNGSAEVKAGFDPDVIKKFEKSLDDWRKSYEEPKKN